MTPPKLTKGPIRSCTGSYAPCTERNEWIEEAIAAGMSRWEISAALGLGLSSLKPTPSRLGAPSLRRRCGGDRYRTASRKVSEGFRAKRETHINGLTFAKLQVAGFKIYQSAARHRDKAPIPARSWARENEPAWPDARSNEGTRTSPRQRYDDHADCRDMGYSRMLECPERHHLAALTPEQREVFDRCPAMSFASHEAAAIAGCHEAGYQRQSARKRGIEELRQLIRVDSEAALLRMMGKS